MKRLRMRPKRAINEQENKLNDTIDQLKIFEEFKKDILPELQEMLLKGSSASEILKKYEGHAAARLVTILLTDSDSGKAIAAAKDIQDRASGKAVERKKVEHIMQDLPDEQLDALLSTELEELDSNDKIQ